MIGLQLVAYREVNRHRELADAAAQVTAQVVLLQHLGQLIAPLYVELIATDGLSHADVLGVDRELVDQATNLEFTSILVESRTALDTSLAALKSLAPTVRLTSGATIGDDVTIIQQELAQMRDSFDAGTQRLEDVRQVFGRLTDLIEHISAQSSDVFENSATTGELASIGVETEQLLLTLQYAATELSLVAEGGITSGSTSAVINSVVAAGAFRSSLDRLRTLLEPTRHDAFDSLVGRDEFAQTEAALAVWVGDVTRVAAEGELLISDPAAIRSMVDVLSVSFVRLNALQAYGDDFLVEEVARSSAVERKADADRRAAISVMIAALAISLLLLLLVLHSILRPLNRLTRQSRQVVEGDLALAPMKPTGPTDIRVVMRSFNEMVATLRTYDAQVRRLALGDTAIDSTLPGPLGDTLRQSVSHLAAVTSKLHASEAAANVQARTDALTGLANRTSALEQLARHSVRARLEGHLSAIVFLDLDGFKSVNDTQGHAEGDRILGEIGARLRVACPDHMVARIGGDEFIVLVGQATDQDEVTELAQRLIEVVSAPCTGSSGQLFNISASAGVAMVDGHTDPLDSIARADSAVYHAKETGRGRVEVYDEQLARDIEDRADMALTMRHGLLNNEFSLRLQPIIDIATKEPIGAEALLRWNRPGIGEVGPGDFIPIAERTGAILDLDAWVLEQSVGILQDWRNDPLTVDLRIAVNISGRHIIDGTLSPLLTRLCDRAGIDPSRLDLEITETHLVADVARASAVVDDLRSQGVKVAIDDFGTGYSSMSYLHRLTVDTLKIDRVFVAGICTNTLDRTIVELLLRLGDSLGLKVVAEGVDSEDKLAELALLGCPWAQGYYIARPMTVPDATVWLRQQVTLASLL